MLIASLANFAGAFVSTAVASFIWKDLLSPTVDITGRLLIAALLGAIAWNLATWYLGLPSSSSHALIGGLVGSGLAAAGSSAIQWHGLWDKAIVPAIQSPIIGFLLAGGIMVAVLWGFRACAPGAAEPRRSGWHRSCPVRRWRSSTAPTTRRRRWA